MKNTALRAAAVAAAALFATTATACSNGSSGEKEDTSAQVKAAADQVVKASPSTSPAASPSASVNAAAMVMSRDVPGLGKIVTDGNGNTLYMFANDTTPKSTCTGACAAGWPPAVVTAKPKLMGTGLKANLLGTTTRSDGKLQAMYNNHPLYYFLGDTKTGQTNGQGLDAFGAKWYVLDEAGNRVTAKPSASPSVSVTASGSASASVGY